MSLRRRQLSGVKGESGVGGGAVIMYGSHVGGGCRVSKTSASAVNEENQLISANISGGAA